MKFTVNKSLASFALSLGILGACLSAAAKIPETYLEHLVCQADYILTAVVIEIKDAGVSPEYGLPSRIAVIKTATTVKGAPAAEFPVRYVPTLSEEPSFTLNKRYLLFLKKADTGVQVVVGYLGVREITDGQVITEEIRGQPNAQSLDQFLDKVKALIGSTHKESKVPGSK